MERRNNGKEVVGKDLSHNSTMDDLMEAMQAQINRMEQRLRIYKEG